MQKKQQATIQFSMRQIMWPWTFTSNTTVIQRWACRIYIGLTCKQKTKFNTGIISGLYYSRVTISVTFGYYIQLIGQTWLFLTVKPLRHSTIMGRWLYRYTVSINVYLNKDYQYGQYSLVHFFILMLFNLQSFTTKQSENTIQYSVHLAFSDNTLVWYIELWREHYYTVCN